MDRERALAGESSAAADGVEEDSQAAVRSSSRTDADAPAETGAAGRSYRWGLWSPSDRLWHETSQELWRNVGAEAPELAEPTIPLRIHQIWLGAKPIPEHCLEMMRSWKAKHPRWDYHLWTDADSPSEEFRSRGLQEAFVSANNPAEKSDILRLELLLRRGGVYVDVDFECLQPLDSLHHRFSFYAGMSNVGAFELNNGLIGSAPGHPLLQYLCKHVTKPWPQWGGEDVDPREAVAYQVELSGLLGMSLFAPQGTSSPTSAANGNSGLPGAPFLASTGPGFFTRAVMRGLRSGLADGGEAPAIVCPQELFYPLPNTQRHLPWAERAKWATASSFAMHHWCRTWWPESEEKDDDRKVAACDGDPEVAVTRLAPNEGDAIAESASVP